MDDGVQDAPPPKKRNPLTSPPTVGGIGGACGVRGGGYVDVIYFVGVDPPPFLCVCSVGCIASDVFLFSLPTVILCPIIPPQHPARNDAHAHRMIW